MNSSAGKVVAGLLLLSALRSLGDDLPHPKPTLSPVVPAEVDAPVDPDGDAIAVFDDYSWRAFIAINWPAKSGIRGTPDETKSIGDFSDPLTKVVWATWKADYELLQKQGTEPTEWSSLDGFTPCEELPFQGSGKTIVLGSFSKFWDFYNVRGCRFGGPLIAQIYTYVRFEVLVYQK
jgi:hypothetical protein